MTGDEQDEAILQKILGAAEEIKANQPLNIKEKLVMVHLTQE